MVQDKYEVINYFDVWGNKTDGWEVNNQCAEGYILVTDYTDYEELVGHLKAMDLLHYEVKPEELEWYNDYEIIELFDKRNGMPLFMLRLVRD
jgi:hypothetical protein